MYRNKKIIMKKEKIFYSAPICVIILLLFMFFGYMSIKTTSSFFPRVFGEKVEVTVTKIDSIESYKKNKTFTYLGEIKFKYFSKIEVLNYRFNESKELGDKFELYYDRDYGFYDSSEFYFIAVLGSFFFVFFVFFAIYIFRFFLRFNQNGSV